MTPPPNPSRVFCKVGGVLCALAIPTHTPPLSAPHVGVPPPPEGAAASGFPLGTPPCRRAARRMDAVGSFPYILRRPCTRLMPRSGLTARPPVAQRPRTPRAFLRRFSIGGANPLPSGCALAGSARSHHRAAEVGGGGFFTANGRVGYSGAFASRLGVIGAVGRVGQVGHNVAVVREQPLRGPEYSSHSSYSSHNFPKFPKLPQLPMGAVVMPSPSACAPLYPKRQYAVPVVTTHCIRSTHTVSASGSPFALRATAGQAGGERGFPRAGGAARGEKAECTRAIRPRVKRLP